MYNSNTSLSTAVFWRTGVLQGIINAAICFYIPFYGATPDGVKSSDSLWAVGKTIYVSMLLVVTMEVALVARYWTLLFVVFTVLSFVCVFPYLLLFPYAEWLVGYFDERQYGVAENLMSSSIFWLCLVLVGVASFAYRCIWENPFQPAVCFQESSPLQLISRFWILVHLYSCASQHSASLGLCYKYGMFYCKNICLITFLCLVGTISGCQNGFSILMTT